MQTQSLTPSIFNFHQHQLRGALINEQPWMVAKDLCAVLGIANSRDVVRRALDPDEWTVYEISTPSRKGVGNSDTRSKAGVGITDTSSWAQRRMMQVVNESGAWALVLKSRKPEAKAVRKWITGEVLPALRKEGSYSLAGGKEVKRPMSNPVKQLSANSTRRGPEEAGVLDARHVPTTTVGLLDGRVRMVPLEGKPWYSLLDVLKCLGLCQSRHRHSCYDTARKLPKAHTARVYLFAGANAGWFVDETALRIVLGSHRLLNSQLTINLD